MTMKEIMRAYLAGCLDCDGAFSIKRSTYHMRVRGDAGQPVFSERVMFAQVKPAVTLLLKEYFGGSYHVDKAAAPNRKPIYRWQATDKNAILCVNAVLPYLKIKREQAELLLELRKVKELPRVQSGTFIMKNKWGFAVTMPRLVVSPEAIKAKEILFNKIKTINDVRSHQPQLIGKGGV